MTAADARCPGRYMRVSGRTLGLCTTSCARMEPADVDGADVIAPAAVPNLSTGVWSCPNRVPVEAEAQRLIDGEEGG